MAQIATQNSDVGWFAVLILGSYGPSDENSKPTSILVFCGNLCQNCPLWPKGHLRQFWGLIDLGPGGPRSISPKSYSDFNQNGLFIQESKDPLLVDVKSSNLEMLSLPTFLKVSKIEIYNIKFYSLKTQRRMFSLHREILKFLESVLKAYIKGCDGYQLSLML